MACWIDRKTPSSACSTRVDALEREYSPAAEAVSGKSIGHLVRGRFIYFTFSVATSTPIRIID